MAQRLFSRLNKLKIAIGFYQIASRVETVYDVHLPAGVRELLTTVQFTISFGFEGIPLACIGASGYISRLTSWILLPLVIVAIILCHGGGRAFLVARGRAVRTALLQSTAPAMLRICFLAYPIVTNVACEAFACYTFEHVGSYLIADVSIVCGSPEHATAQDLAWFAIFLYPVGLLVLNGGLLTLAREAILSEKPSLLSRAIGFLHSEYLPVMYLWELMEMARRFILVGLFVIGPYHKGSMMQLAVAALTCVIFLLVQAQAMPYRSPSDNYFGTGCSFALTVLFLTCIFFKVNALTDQQSLQQRMSLEQRQDLVLPATALSVINLLSVIGALVLSAILFMMQVAQRKRDLNRQAAMKQQLLLRYVRTDEPVQLPALEPGHYHLFLSHVWKTGQDSCRVIKQRLGEMIPGARIFLDVDDLEEIADLEGYIARSHSVLVYLSAGYVASKNCMRELVSAVEMRKPLITIVDPDADRGGLTMEEARAQLVEAAESSFLRWGFDENAPSGEALFDALTSGALGRRSSSGSPSSTEIEWNRIGVFQEVSLRLIAERLLPRQRRRSSADSGEDTRRRRSNASSSEDMRRKSSFSPRRLSSAFMNWRSSQQAPSIRSSFSSYQIHAALTYTKKDITRAAYILPAPRSGRRFHLYCSRQVYGSLELAQEVQKAHGLDLRVSQELADLQDCERMLVYLHKGTWRIGEASEIFAREVATALCSGVQLLLAHEMLGVDQEARGGVEFADFFECEQGTTPQQLLRAGIYSQIAVALKGGQHRKVSMALLAKALVDVPEDVQSITEGSSLKLDALASNAASQSDAQTPMVLHDAADDCLAGAKAAKATGGLIQRWRRRFRPANPILSCMDKRSDDRGPPGSSMRDLNQV